MGPEMISDIQTVLDNKGFINGKVIDGSWCRVTQHGYTGWANRHNHPTVQPANVDQLDDEMRKEISWLKTPEKIEVDEVGDMEDLFDEPNMFETEDEEAKAVDDQAPQAGFEETIESVSEDTITKEPDLFDDDEGEKMIDDMSEDEFDDNNDNY